MNARQFLNSPHWMAVPLMLVLLLAFVLPVSIIMIQAVWSPQQGFNALPLLRMASVTVYAKVMWRTLEISAYVMALCVLLAYPLAYTIHKACRRERSALYLLVLLPFWTSFMVKAFSWMVILGRNGAVNSLLVWMFGEGAARSFLFDTGAVLIGMVHGLLPFAVLAILPVLDATDNRLVPAALSMGAGAARAFFRITLPLSVPGIAAAALIIFVTSLGFFIVPALLGGPQQTMAANLIIELILDLVNWPLAGAAALLMLLVVCLLFVAYIKGFGIETLIGRSRVSSIQRKRSRLGSHRILGGVLRMTEGALLQRYVNGMAHAMRMLSWFVALFLAVPILFLIPVSFSDSGIIDWPPSGFSWRWYQALNLPNWREAGVRSLGVATATALLSLCVAFPAARWFVQHARGARGAALIFMLAPMVVPRVILAIGLYFVLSKLQLIGGSLALVVGHVVIALPFVMIALIAVLQGYDERLDAAASVCGASTWQRLRKVTLPIVAPGLASAGLFAFITSLDELTIALFLTGGLGSTIPKQMWDEASLKVSPTLAAASTLLFLLMSTVVLMALTLRKKQKHADPL